MGCLRSLYFNRQSVLEHLNTSRAAYHGGAAIYGCHKVDNSCLQFPHSGTFVQVCYFWLVVIISTLIPFLYDHILNAILEVNIRECAVSLWDANTENLSL